jgi:hypothetical protein
VEKSFDIQELLHHKSKHHGIIKPMMHPLLLVKELAKDTKNRGSEASWISGWMDFITTTQNKTKQNKTKQTTFLDR